MLTSSTWPETYQPGVMLKSGECLRTNEYLHSYNAGFFAIMQSDGNFVVYKGTCPSDNRGFVWHTGRTGGGGKFFAIMQEDGNFCIYHGEPGNQGALLWDYRRTAPGKQFLAVLRDDGVFAVFNGEAGGFSLPAIVMWDSQTKATPGYKLILDQNTGDAAEASVSRLGQDFWQSFTPDRTASLARVDVASAYTRAGMLYQCQLELHEGIGTGGPVLGTSKFVVDYSDKDSRIVLPWRNIYFDRAIPLTAGAKYTLHFTMVGPQSTPVPFYFQTKNPYAGGSCSMVDNLVFKTYCTPPWMPWPYPPIE